MMRWDDLSMATYSVLTTPTVVSTSHVNRFPCLRLSLHTSCLQLSSAFCLPLSYTHSLSYLFPFTLFVSLLPLCMYIAIYLPIVFSPGYFIAADNLSTQRTSGFYIDVMNSLRYKHSSLPPSLPPSPLLPDVKTNDDEIDKQLWGELESEEEMEEEEVSHVTSCHCHVTNYDVIAGVGGG